MNETERTKVDYIVFEGEMARLERELRRAHIVTALSIVFAAVIFVIEHFT